MAVPRREVELETQPLRAPERPPVAGLRVALAAGTDGIVALEPEAGPGQCVQARERAPHALFGGAVGRMQVEPFELEPGCIVRLAELQHARHANDRGRGKPCESVDLGVEAPALGDRQTLREAALGAACQCPAILSAWRLSAGPKRWRS